MYKFPTMKEQLIHHEGIPLKPYRCTAGKLTIGVGRNLDDKGITEKEALYLLDNDISECIYDLMEIFGVSVWECFSNSRQRALIDLRFNLGPNRFRMFRKMLSAIRYGDWKQASEELKDSNWWTQVQPDRKELLFKQLRTGDN